MTPIIDSHMHLSKDGLSDSFDSELIAHIEKTIGQMAEQKIVMGVVAHGLPAVTLDQVVARYGSVFKGLLHARGWFAKCFPARRCSS